MMLFQISLYLLHCTNVQLGIFSSLSLLLRSEEEMSECYLDFPVSACLFTKLPPDALP